MIELLNWSKDNWHKILVVLIALIHAWKFFIEYIRPVVHKSDDEEVIIKIPKKGLIIKIERNED